MPTGGGAGVSQKQPFRTTQPSGTLEYSSSVTETSRQRKTKEGSSQMVLQTEWAQVESIDLVNDGGGLGFGIVGGKSTGVVVKTLVGGGAADRVSNFSCEECFQHLTYDKLYKSIGWTYESW